MKPWDEEMSYFSLIDDCGYLERRYMDKPILFPIPTTHRQTRVWTPKPEITKPTVLVAGTALIQVLSTVKIDLAQKITVRVRFVG